jgi:hypothetical protein
MKMAVEMPGHGKRGKPKAGFPSLSTALGNRSTRFPHSHRHDEQWKRWKAKGRLPTFPLHYDSLIEDFKKGGLAAELRSFRLIVRL